MRRPVGEDTTGIDEDALPWWPGDDRRRGDGRSGLTRRRIIDAGVDLVATEGFAALTMRRVAGSLDCGVMSLYWYVATRDELVAVVVDELLRGVPTPAPTTTWRQQVVEVCEAFVSILRPHRRVLAGFPGGIAPGPQMLRMTNDIYGALGTAGFQGADLFHGVDAIGSLTVGLVFRDSADEAAAVAAERTAPRTATPGTLAPASMQGVDFGVLDGRLYPHLVAAGVRSDHDDGFEFALDTLLDGLEVRLRRHGPARPCGDS
jgi:AcrR family transcriptional regulator